MTGRPYHSPEPFSWKQLAAYMLLTVMLVGFLYLILVVILIAGI